MTQPRDPRRPPPPQLEEEPALDLGLEPDPQPLELPIDALILEEPQGFSTEEAQPLDPYVEPEEQIPLVEGFEATGLEERISRPRPEDRNRARKPIRPDFVFATCPACEAQQPDPAPAFCENCGQRLRKPGKKSEGSDAARTKRCGECGYKNQEEAKACTNCGMRI